MHNLFSPERILTNASEVFLVLAADRIQLDLESIAHVGNGAGDNHFAVGAQANLTGNLRRYLRVEVQTELRQVSKYLVGTQDTQVRSLLKRGMQSGGQGVV